MRQETEKLLYVLWLLLRKRKAIVGFWTEKWPDLTYFSRAAPAAKTTLGQRQTPPLEPPFGGLVRINGDWTTVVAAGMGAAWQIGCAVWETEASRMALCSWMRTYGDGEAMRGNSQGTVRNSALNTLGLGWLSDILPEIMNQWAHTTQQTYHGTLFPSC